MVELYAHENPMHARNRESINALLKDVYEVDDDIKTLRTNQELKVIPTKSINIGMGMEWYIP